MLSIESVALARKVGPGGEGRSVENLSAVLREALNSFLSADGDLPRTARETSAAALAVLEPSDEPGGGSLVHYRGHQQFFPSDLVGLFYLCGAYLQIQTGALAEDGYVERDVLRMVRGGDIDAANLLFDRITGTLSGPELADANLELFARRRERLDQILQGIGITGMCCKHKIWDRAPYGRDAQLLGPDHDQDNRITAVAAASLFTKLLLGQLGGYEASRKILDLLQVDAAGARPGPRGRQRSATGLPPGSQAWGWRASGPRILHEVTAVELPSNTRYVLVFLSHLGEKNAGMVEILGRTVAEGLCGW
jgi:hypothetical protein